MWIVNVDIDSDLYDGIKRIIRKNKYDYPSIKFFVQKAIFNELRQGDIVPVKKGRVFDDK